MEIYNSEFSVTSSSYDTSDSSSGTTNEQLTRLFKACDQNDNGYIIRTELEEMCMGLGLSTEDADAIFEDLDVDRDGKISFKDFSTGFKEFLDPEIGTFSSSISERISSRKASMWSIHTTKTQVEDEIEGTDDEGQREEFKQMDSVHQAWTFFTHTLLDTQLLSLSEESRVKVQQLYRELHCRKLPDNVVIKVESVVHRLMKEVEDLNEQNKSLKEQYTKEKTNHVHALQTLGDEMDNQVALLEQRAKATAKLESEEEKKKLHEQMDLELQEMKAHLKLYEKVDTWLQKENRHEDTEVKELRHKLTRTCSVNRELQDTVQSTSTELGLLRSELTQSRTQYEDKCKELHMQREQALQYMHQFEHMKRQMNLIHDANKRLQDINDSLRSKNDHSFDTLSSHSSARSGRARHHSRTSGQENSPLNSNVFLPDGEESVRDNFGIRRFLDDLDSGLSTLPDKCDDQVTREQLLYCNDPPSLDAELYSAEQEYQTPPQGTVEDRGRPNNSYISFKASDLDIEEIVTERMSPMVSSTPKSSSPQTIIRVQKVYKIVLAGDAAVGKTAFITRLCHGVFVPNMASTLGVDYKVKRAIVDEKEMVIQLWDTAGQERFRSISRSYFRRADAILLLYSISSVQSFNNVRQWLQSIEDTCVNKIPLVLCGHKKDLRSLQNKLGQTSFVSIRPENGLRLAEECGAVFFEASSKTGEGIQEIFEELARQMSIREDENIHSSVLQISQEKKKNNSKCCSKGS